MGDYEIELSHKATKQFAELGTDIQRRVAERIDGLAADPRPPGVEKLQGVKNAWRIRAGTYRIVYSVDDADRIVKVARIAHRRDVYRGL